jgi:hypothetical protein
MPSGTTHPQKPTKCGVCGVALEQKQAGRPRSYCSEPCKVRARQWRGIERGIELMRRVLKEPLPAGVTRLGQQLQLDRTIWALEADRQRAREGFYRIEQP